MGDNVDVGTPWVAPVYHAWVLMLAPQPPMGEFYHFVE